MKLEAFFYFFQKCNLIFFSGRDVFESAALISLSAILDFHSQHSVHSAPVSRMDGMAFCPFRNRNAEWKNARILHSVHSHSRIENKKNAPLKGKYHVVSGIFG